MKKILLLLTVTVCCYSISNAQNASIKGITTDTINKQNLPNTVISLLRAKDSILVKFTRSNAKGDFELKNLPAGDYLLFVTYPQYADYAENITLTDTSKVNTGPLKLILKANLLQDVIVKQQIGNIRLKGDTTEFIADSFKVQPNATVEDLLKKMPGIQIDKNGKITAQGETVQKVLVDGEEFFGDDPTLVTQNLRADMVGTVQVYDKKSDQATFTGIDDGSREKTINLKLKAGKKNGYFGRLNLSGGTGGYHDNQLMANIFKDKKKFAGYGIVSNTGKTGLNWQDLNNYGDQGNNMTVSDDGGVMIMFGGGGDDFENWNGQYNGQGFPLVQTGGLHFNNKWNDDKTSINGNYKIMNFMVNGSSATNSQNILSNNLINYTNDYQTFKNKILRNRVNGAYEVQFDSSTSMKITADGGSDHKITSTSDSSESLTNSDLVNRSKRNLSSDGINNIVNSNILLRKKFKKVGRTLSFNMRENYSSNNATGYLYSAIDSFYKSDFGGRTITDQFKSYSSRSTLIDTKLTYTEPLSKISSLIFNYGVVISSSNSERNSYNKAADGKYSDYDSVYSNHYQFNFFTHRMGVAYNFAKKKLRFNIGNNIGLTSFDQTNLHNDSVSKRNFVNFYPTANFSYAFTQQRRISLNYSGNTRQPSIQQIQPVATNDDPLNITVGNANLKPEFDNNINLFFNDYKVLSQRGIFLGVFYRFSENDIVNSTNFDPASGKRVNQYVNLNGNRSLSGWLGYNIKLKKLDAYLNFNGDVNSSRNVNVVNNVLNVTKSGNYTGRIGFNKDKENKFSLGLNASATYTSSNSSIQSNVTTNYWTFDIQPNLDVYLPWKLQLHADADYNIRQKTPIFTTNNNVFLLNAWFGKKMLKNDALVLKISGNDILDQNIGFSRTVSSNFITQNTYSTIRRYFFLSAVWNFNKAGVKAPTGMF
ncbi:MAG TPA: TonB-dependent receptor [Chitinophagaceae bacterium]|nr:TonB-dependent receptor [Chitinophagaceae bacterium]